jgi:iron complex transport system substrate-binding protein
MRIVSLLPAATEILYALGVGGEVVGVSHECAYPPEASHKPRVTRSLLPARETQAAIDAEVTRRLRAGEPIYETDAELIEALAPELVIAQDLCEVCAASPKDLVAALARLSRTPQMLRLAPRSLGGILQDILEIGRAVGRDGAAHDLVARCEARMESVRSKAAAIPSRPRICCLEWMDPPYGSGHWAAEMTILCNASDALGRVGADSVRIAWEDVLAWAPETLIVMPCGFDLETVLSHAEALPSLPGWTSLPAVRAGKVFAVDADAYFARPGPRAFDGLELMAHHVHPEHFDWGGGGGAFAPIRTKVCEACASPFVCRPEPGCWCEKIELPAGAAAALACDYGDCLCPRCLEAGAGRAKERVSGADSRSRTA